MAGGRPSDYTQEMADFICAELADGKSLRSICRDSEDLNTGKVMRWLASNKDFQEQYARARELQADALFDETLDIADQYDSAKDASTPDVINRAKLRIDTRKWIAGKLRPKKYGDKIQQEHTGADGSPLQINIVRFSDTDPK